MSFCRFYHGFSNSPQDRTMKLQLCLGESQGTGVGLEQAKLWNEAFPEEQWLRLTWAHVTQDTRILPTQHLHTGEVSLCVRVTRHPLVFTHETVHLSVSMTGHNSLGGNILAFQTD